MLTGKQKRFLRAEGSLLKPVVIIGKEGLTEAVVKECDNTLTAKELVKVRVQKNCFSEPKELGKELAEKTNSILVQTAGRNFLLYRENKEKNIYQLP